MTLLIILVPVEGPPRFLVDALSDGDEARLKDWLTTSPVLVHTARDCLRLLDALREAADEPEEGS